MDPLLRALDEAVEFARTFRFEMTPDYLALIERVEALPINQDDADKSGLWRGHVRDRQHFKNARRVR